MNTVKSRDLSARVVAALATAILVSAAGPGCGGGGGGASVAPIPGSASLTPGYAETVVGTGIAGQGQEDVGPLQSDLYLPMDVSFGPDGNLYIVDWNNHRIRVLKSGKVTTIIGNGYIGDAQDGPAADVRMNHPTHIAWDAQGRMIISAWHNSKIIRYEPSSRTVTTIAGTGARAYGGDGVAGGALAVKFDLPAATAVSTTGLIYIVDQANQIIRVLDPGTATVTRTAGTIQSAGFSGDNGPALAAKLSMPAGQSAPPGGKAALDAAGNLFFCDSGNHCVRKVAPNGTITTVAGIGGAAGFSGDGGAATAAKLNTPSDVEVDAAGNLYIADTENCCVRLVNAAGTISTLAGKGGVRGFSGDGGKATEALFDRPYGVALAPNGDVYVADTENHRIRRVRNVSYGAHVLPTLAKNGCNAAACHGTHTNPGGGYQLLTYTSTDPSVHSIVSFGHLDTASVDQSLILRVMDSDPANNGGGQDMPLPGSPRVGAADFDLIRDWIRQGAPNN